MGLLSISCSSLDYFGRIIPEITYLDRFHVFRQLNFAPCHKPIGEMIAPAMKQKRFLRYSAQMRFKFLYGTGNGNLAPAFAIAVNEVTETKIITDETFQILQKVVRILIDKSGLQFKSLGI